MHSSTKKTYILAITKKSTILPQKEPVFTYLVTNIGETLDAKRFECENDLPQMVKLYKYFLIDRNNFKTDDSKCKVQPISKFDPSEHWSVDRWWSEEEKIALGLKEEQIVLTIDEFQEQLQDFRIELRNVIGKIKVLKK